MSAGCSICAHPQRAEIDQKLATGVPVLSICREHGLETSRRAVYRHISSRHVVRPRPAPDVPQALKDGTQASTETQATETVRKATRLARSAERHMRAALKSDDLKAANGAISSAVKAFELFGKASGHLQNGANVSVTVSTEQRMAVDLHDAASALSAYETTEQARAWLSAQLEAGDPDAERVVIGLMRMVRSAAVESDASR